MTSKQLPKGHVSILDTRFKYTPSSGTNVAETFVRVRARQARAAAMGEQSSNDELNTVHPIRKRGFTLT